MSPVLQALVAVAVGIFLGVLLLSEMAFVVCGNPTHVGEVILVVFRRLFLRILLENLNDFATTVD
jgi:hypothetical protein